jgi:hypothetical protein
MQLKLGGVVKRLTIVLIVLPTALFVLVFGFIQWRQYADLRAGEVQQIWNPNHQIVAYYLNVGGNSFLLPTHLVVIRGRGELSRHEVFSGIFNSGNQHVAIRLLWVDSQHLKVICRECGDFLPNVQVLQWRDVSISYCADEDGLPPLRLVHKPWR